jgi:HlyD family secretion protein
VGFVEVGQRVKLKLAAYSFQKYGLFEGQVEQLRADAQEPEAAARATGAPHVTPPLTYKAVIELDAQSLTLPSGRRLALAPEMAATVEIHQGRWTVMEYLLSPVQKVSSEAGRER